MLFLGWNHCLELAFSYFGLCQRMLFETILKSFPKKPKIPKKPKKCGLSLMHHWIVICALSFVSALLCPVHAVLAPVQSAALAALRPALLPPPALVPGTSTLADLGSANRYERDVQSRVLDAQALPLDEAASFKYRVELALDQSVPLPGQPITYAGLTNVINAAIANNFNMGFAGHVNNMNMGFARLETLIMNGRSRAYNNVNCIRTPESTLLPILKEAAGHPTGIVLPPGSAPAAIGAAPPNWVPTTLDQVRAISTNARFDQIFWFYNDPSLASDGSMHLNARAASVERFFTR